MKTTQLIRVALAALMAITVAWTAPSGAKADDVALHRLLTGPDRCDHVISLLMRYGVNNDHPSSNGFQVPHPLGPFQMPASELGDLQLVSVAQHGAPRPGCGPAFDVVVKNCSTRDVHSMRLTLVGLFGRLCPTSPNRTETIECIGPGQTAQLTVTLPIESLSMGSYNGTALPLRRLLVVLDSYDQFFESNETNNLRLMDLTAIPVVTVSETVTTTTAVGSADAPSAPEASGIATPTPKPLPEGQAPTETAPETSSPSTAQPSAAAPELRQSDLRSAIDQFGQQTGGASAVDSTVE